MEPSYIHQKTRLSFISGWETIASELCGHWIWSQRKFTSSVIYASTAHEIRTDLEERFQRSNGPQFFSSGVNSLDALRDLSLWALISPRLRGFGKKELGEYNPIRTCNCGGVQPLINNYLHHQYVLNLLRGLNESFSHVWGQIWLQHPTPSMNRVLALGNSRSVGSISSKTSTSGKKETNVFSLWYIWSSCEKCYWD